MMKLQSNVSREVNGKRYFKHTVVIPSKIISKLGWKKGDSIEVKAGNKYVVLAKGVQK